MSLDAGLQRIWYGPAWQSVFLWPLAWLFRLLVAARQRLYRLRILTSRRVGAPVIIVGNLTVGGTGKTPVASWLAGELSALGHRVGIVLRGYGGSHRGPPLVVDRQSDPAVVGDEAVLHARRKVHVVVVGADRVAAAERAIEQGAEVIVCDDGLQHLRLARDCEFVVVDAMRGLGNGWMLPAGPLRERPGRLSEVDAVILAERQGARQNAVPPPLPVPLPMLARVSFRPGTAVNIATGERRPLESFRGQRPLAVAGIGNPEAFFDGLRSAGLDIDAKALPDHARISSVELDLDSDRTVLMTEKDAVKCQDLARPLWWYVELELEFAPADELALLSQALTRTGLHATGEIRG